MDVLIVVQVFIKNSLQIIIGGYDLNMDWIKQILNFLKSSPVIIISIFIASALILFLPNSFIEKLYLLNLKNEYGTYLGLAFILSGSILLVLSTVKAWKKILNKYENKKLHKARLKYLTELDSTKTEIIKEFIEDEKHTLRLPMNNGPIIELEFYGIISRAGEISPTEIYKGEFVIQFYLQPWTIKMINRDEFLKKKFL